jgi:S1-C subfamily serine protease
MEPSSPEKYTASDASFSSLENRREEEEKHGEGNTPSSPSAALSLPRRLTWLLLGFLLALGLFTQRSTPERVYEHAQLGLPPVEAPTGQLAKVYEVARPASLQIEARSSDPSYLGAPIGIGTGFFISADGFVLTAYHVVDKSEIGDSSDFRRSVKYVAKSPDETEYDLELIGFDAYFDLAILKAKVTADVPFLPLASTVSKEGDDIVAIGNSRNDFLEARAGTISRIGVDRPTRGGRFADDTIEVTAALAPGDSGGPVINEQGEVIGVVSFISFVPDRLNSDTDRSLPPFLRGIVTEPRDFAAYAVPVSSSNDMIARLRMGERKDVPVIGFSWARFDYNPRTDEYQLGERPGPVVQEVQPGSPADLAGIQSLQVVDGELASADVIVAIDDESTETFYELLEVIYLKGVGETVTVTVQRGNEILNLTLELGAKSQVFN